MDRILLFVEYTLIVYTFPAQAIEAIKYVHSKGVIHCDIGAHNFMVSNDMSLVLANFCDSILDDSTVIVTPLIRYCPPIPMEERLLNIPIRNDLFTLVSCCMRLRSGVGFGRAKMTGTSQSCMRRGFSWFRRGLRRGWRGLLRSAGRISIKVVMRSGLIMLY